MSKMSVADAKGFFISMDCSAFIMARENWPLYQEYLKLEIPKSIETGWRKERLREVFSCLKQGKRELPFWKNFNKLVELSSSIKDIKNFQMIFDALRENKQKLESHERVIIAETIVGRLDISQRRGLIFEAFDLGNKKLAQAFIEETLLLLKIESNDPNILIRVERAKNTCVSIKN